MGKEETKKFSLAKQASWLLVAKTLSFVFSFALPLLITRIFDQGKVGLYQQVFLIVATLSTILALNFGMSAYYYLPREPENRSKTILNILIFNFCIGIIPAIVFTLYPQLPGILFKSSSEYLEPLAPLIGVVTFFWLFSSFLEIAPIANQEASIGARFIVFSQFSKTLLLFSFGYFFASVEALLYAALIHSVIQSLILLYYLNTRFPKIWAHFDFEVFKRQFYYALPYGLSGLLWILQLDMHRYFVGNHFSLEEFSIYSIGCFSLPLIGILAESTSSVVTPRISELQQAGNKRQIAELVIRVFYKLSLVYFAIYVFLMVVADTFIPTLFTHKYLASVVIFMINISLLPIDGLIMDGVARAYPEIGRFLVKIRIFVIVGLAITLYFGIRHFDLRGMIAIVIVVNFLERVITAIKVGRVLEVQKSDFVLLSNVGRTAVASLLAGVLTYFAYNFVKSENTVGLLGLAADSLGKYQDFVEGSIILGISGLIFAMLYAMFLFLFGALAENERILIQRWKDKLLGSFSGKETAKTLT